MNQHFKILNDNQLLTLLKCTRYLLDKEYNPEDYAMACFLGGTPSECIDQTLELYDVIKAEMETRGYQVHQHLAVIPLDLKEEETDEHR